MEACFKKSEHVFTVNNLRKNIFSFRMEWYGGFAQYVQFIYGYHIVLTSYLSCLKLQLYCCTNPHRVCLIGDCPRGCFNRYFAKNLNFFGVPSPEEWRKCDKLLSGGVVSVVDVIFVCAICK